ncbi:acireductone synthase [Leptospira interrogans]|uniref:2,3-diketo-5-methylthio-1-phosphopentane phosphatase n=1 Tax=Leptospira interrogans serovar Lora str. TE 1992 TaxID=1193028 RepID=M3E8J0_LEPIR|nr:acireductone synthase [Leptospira interrogans]EMF43145.1 2,3-diketo-5-methylthio-1-phosphopentane phosphatase [Leptospira interrogans serovar Lora str. TE 1992]AKH78047.1 enolase [Leptospira interrogans serovar Bratislava]EMN07155.1 2,3-diketo-5-methylthio-1-phosphopentane phosphatase [Leptospira interrogans serovar Muenchen str. Brem 129]KWV22387.1 enolase-phosphatase E-1 [Leptospira interrogans]KWV23430.1 enolase-phosphatase E-1 [Leptospira interrogans]
MNIKTFEFYLFDIEGTTTPIEFVHKILFPYSVEKFDSFFQSNLLEKEWIEKLILEGKNDTTYSGKLSDSAFDLSEYCKHLVSLDCKSGILKEIQGRIWKSGYENGELKSSMFSDVPSFLKKIQASKKKSAVYSSGSIQAQKLIFEYSDFGNLTHFFYAYFDTGVGGKRESSSYSKISEQLGVAPEKILFFTDIKEEADAAKEAKLHSAILERPGNYPQPQHSHFKISSFEGLNP